MDSRWRKRGIIAFGSVAALGAGLAWLIWQGRGVETAGQVPSRSTAQVGAPSSSASAHRFKARKSAPLRQVEKFVAKKNEEERKLRELFVAEGWREVAVEAPDPDITDLEPAALADGKRAALHVQISSNSFVGKDLVKLAGLFSAADRYEDTQERILEALGRSQDRLGGDLLARIGQKLPRESRLYGRALDAIFPRGPEDQATEFLIQELSRDDVPGARKEEILAKLVALALAQSRVDQREALSSRIAGPWRERFQQRVRELAG